MSEQAQLLRQTVERVLKAIASADFANGWAEIEDAGLSSVLITEEAGGYGGSWSDAADIFRLCGLHATAFPLSESIVARATLAKARGDIRDGLAIAGGTPDGVFDGGCFTGTIRDVPWGRHAKTIIAAAGAKLLAFDCRGAKVLERRNSADEPRDSVVLQKAPARVLDGDGWSADRFRKICAAMRAAQIGGALEATLALAIEYTSQRKQFGRPLSAFQSIQHQLALLAEETAAANLSASSAFLAIGRGAGAFEAAAAKFRANQAAASGAGIAHQVHGAMGYTMEYPLQKFTRRLGAWRSEHGNELHWAAELGAGICRRGAADFWSDLVALSDSPAPQGL